MLVTQWCFICGFAQHQGWFFLSLPTLKTDWGVCKRLGRDTTRQMSQRNQRGIPHCIKSSNKKGRGRLAPFCLETGSTSLTVWAGKQLPLHHLFCCILFLPYYFFTFYLFFLSQPISFYWFLLFLSSFSVPPGTQGKWAIVSVVLSCLFAFMHNTRHSEWFYVLSNVCFPCLQLPGSHMASCPSCMMSQGRCHLPRISHYRPTLPTQSPQTVLKRSLCQVLEHFSFWMFTYEHESQIISVRTVYLCASELWD